MTHNGHKTGDLLTQRRDEGEGVSFACNVPDGISIMR